MEVILGLPHEDAGEDMHRINTLVKKIVVFLI